MHVIEPYPLLRQTYRYPTQHRWHHQSSAQMTWTPRNVEFLSSYCSAVAVANLESRP